MAKDSEDKLLDPLVFRLHSSAPDVVRQVLLELGWKEYDDEQHSKPQWNLQWRGSAFCATEHENIRPWQRLNHHPKTVRMMRKDSLARHLKRMQGVYGATQYEFSPVAFILPNDYTKFVAEYSKERESHQRKTSYWICKPADLSRGRGIFIFEDIKDLTYDCTVIVQKYIANPLLISGYKFDLRIYVCVTSFSPLTVYVYQEGLVRFATEKFDLSSLDNIYSHLTNTSINKFGASYSKDKGRVGCGCKWTLGQFRSYLHSLEMDDALLWQRIHNIVTLTLLAIAPSVPQCHNCFELFGFDILIDESFKPWLLEVNFSPALSLDCSSDVTVKKSLIQDLVELLNYKASDSSMKIDSGKTAQSGMKSFSGLSQGTNKQLLGYRPEEKSANPLQSEHFDATKSTSWITCNGSFSAKQVCQKLPCTDPPRPSKEENFENSCHPGKGTHETCNILPCDKCFDHTLCKEDAPQRLNGVSLNREVMINGSITGNHPKKTLTSRLRERMNMPQLTPPSARTRQCSNISFPSARRPKSIVAPNRIVTVPMYYVSDIDQRPLPQVGDFVLVFPFNEATYEASKNKTNMKLIIQEINRQISRLLSPQQEVKRRKDELTFR
ncbi:probable tubulin polyglutamylase TTLL2 [Ambystoma mexicanum]|uniref:probable tubulin polyglutamylase TTLL2 n=1 Tax=Ambystoma mexicanum TaxID=8296 RepID=UPI0037E7386D